MSLDLHFLTEAALDDPRLADYRDLRDRPLAESSGRFVAESELVVRKLLGTGLRVHSILLTAPRLAALEPALTEHAERAEHAGHTGTCPIFVVPQSVMDGIAGFHVHRGCLAIAERPVRPSIPPNAHTVVVPVDLVDVDNLGSMTRNAAAFGADAMLLSPRCADPFYRKAVRTSAGAVLSLPIARATRWPDDLLALREGLGFELVGAVVDKDALPLATFVPAPRTALLFGSEGPGLDRDSQSLCDKLVTIPMGTSATVDSLNVATAAAVFLYHVTQVRGAAPNEPKR